MFIMKKTLWLLAFLGILFTSSKCDKKTIEPDTETLPPITNTGVEKLGCLINGKVWVTGAPYFLSNPKTSFNIDTVGKYLNISAIKDKDLKSMSLYFNYVEFQIGSYKINYNDIVFRDHIKCASSPNYELDTMANNIVKINFIDKTKRIVSGEFNFNCINKGCKDSAIITNGRFDLNFNYW